MHNSQAYFNINVGMYASVLALPFGLQDYVSDLFSNIITIYCGNTGFVSIGDSNQFFVLDPGLVLVGGYHGGDLDAGLVTGTAVTFNHDYSTDPLELPFQMVVLGDQALHAGSSNLMGLGSISSLTAYDQIIGFDKATDIEQIAYQTTMSFTMLHELFHVAESNTSMMLLHKLRLLLDMVSGANNLKVRKGSDEVYGWPGCAAIQDIAISKYNADSLAFYAMSK